MNARTLIIAAVLGTVSTASFAGNRMWTDDLINTNLGIGPATVSADRTSAAVEVDIYDQLAQQQAMFVQDGARGLAGRAGYKGYDGPSSGRGIDTDPNLFERIAHEYN